MGREPVSKVEVGVVQCSCWGKTNDRLESKQKSKLVRCFFYKQKGGGGGVDKNVKSAVVSPGSTLTPDVRSVCPCPPAVRQYADICLFSTAQYKCPVAQLEAE